MADKFRKDRIFAGQQFGQSPRAINRRQKDVCKRGLIVGRGTWEGGEIDEVFSVEFKDRKLQVNSVGIGMINEFPWLFPLTKITTQKRKALLECYHQTTQILL